MSDQDVEEEVAKSVLDFFLEILGYVFLFFLVFGMSATVDIRSMKKQVRNKVAISTGVFLQFVLLPFLGFAVVKMLNMSSEMGLTLLVVTSSPGGSYSNWWCSMFNADLALSVTMTAISTLLSTIMLPLNLIIYTSWVYEGDVVSSLDWMSLFIALGIVISAITGGLVASATVHSHKFNRFANMCGNYSGIALVIFSAVVSSLGGGQESDEKVEKGWIFYVGVAAPCVLGVCFSHGITTYFGLKAPERVTVSVECCYQNVGIATSVALTMFEGNQRAQAMAVPLYYGAVEAVVVGLYCVVAWKVGWTKAPANASIWTVIVTSYEVVEAETEECQEIEVTLSEAVAMEHMSGTGGTMFHYFNMDAVLQKLDGMYGKNNFALATELGRRTPVSDSGSRRPMFRRQSNQSGRWRTMCPSDESQMGSDEASDRLKAEVEVLGVKFKEPSGYRNVELNSRLHDGARSDTDDGTAYDDDGDVEMEREANTMRIQKIKYFRSRLERAKSGSPDTYSSLDSDGNLLPSRLGMDPIAPCEGYTAPGYPLGRPVAVQDHQRIDTEVLPSHHLDSGERSSTRPPLDVLGGDGSVASSCSSDVETESGRERGGALDLAPSGGMGVANPAALAAALADYPASGATPAWRLRSLDGISDSETSSSRFGLSDERTRSDLSDILGPYRSRSDLTDEQNVDGQEALEEMIDDELSPPYYKTEEEEVIDDELSPPYYAPLSLPDGEDQEPAEQRTPGDWAETHGDQS